MSTNFNPTPFTAKDGSQFAAVIAGVDSLGNPDVLKTDGSGNLNISATVSGADGAIQDGADSSIKATVLDYTNSNPLAVRLTDTNGDYIAAGAGTQYTEDVAAASDPIGNMLLARRKDTLSTSEVSADGDNIALNATNKGQLHVKLADTVTVDGSGVTQPISAASLPLPTGAATSTKQSDGSQKTQIVDGSGNVIGATSNALDVNIKSGSSAGTEYNEDAAAAANPSGPMTMAVRADSLSGLTTTDGDNVAVRATDKGEMYVKHADSIAVTSATFATAAKQDTGNTSLASIDGKITAVNTGAVVVSSSALPSGAATSTKQSDGSQKTQIVDGSGNVIGATSNALDINIKSGNPTSITANAGTNLNTSALALESGGNLATLASAIKAEDAASADADKGIVVQVIQKATPADTAGTDGDYSPIQMSGGRVWVDASGKTLTVGSHAVTNAGTFAVQVDGAALTALQLIDDTVFAEDAAHTTADKGIQSLAVRRDTASALGADNDYTPLTTNARAATWVAIEDGAGGQITSFGGGTQYTEDAAAAANPVGNALIGVRADTLAGVTTTDGDNVAARMTDKGELYVKHADSVAVTSATFATAAKQDTGNTSLSTIAGAVSGTEMQVDVLTMPTVQVQSNSANLATQTTAAAIQTAAELIDDTVATTASAIPSKGIAVSGTDGTNARVIKTDSSGELQVDVLTMPTVTVNSHAVTNAGTFAVQVDGSALTSLQLIDDPVATLGTTTYTEAATKGMLVGAVRRDADTTLVDTTNEAAPLIVDARGLLKVEAFSGEALPVTDNSASLTVDAPVGTPVFVRLSDGASAISTLPVSLASVPSHAVTNAGTFAVQVDGSALTALQLIDDPVQVLGTDTYTEASSKGVTIGAVRRDADTTLVDTTNEFGPLQMDANGRLKVEVFDGGDSHTVDANNLDIRDLTSASDSVATRTAPTTTATLSNVAGSASSVTLLSSNSGRYGATIANDSSAVLYVKLGTTASTTSYTIKLSQDDYYEVPAGYTGRIDGIWASATGSARVTEITA